MNNDTFGRLNRVRGILFDLDNTLYPREKGVFDRINERIDSYVARWTDRPGSEVSSLRREYIDRYGTTLGGLKRHHGVDPGEYMEYVHDVPVEEMLDPDEGLSRFLGAIELPKFIFTNASAAHAARVLAALGVGFHFEGIIDLADTGYLGKPDKQAFASAVGRLGAEPGETLFVDDIPANVQAARQLGILTAHVGEGGNGIGDFSAGKATELGELFAGTSWYRCAGSPQTR
ncbi:MAG: pyrimidine 5'-nucleotidase [bacterium]|nr:pyrimidine 5'-nucleotidase [bacterium]